MLPHFKIGSRAIASEDSDGLRLLLVALAGITLFHGGLLPFTHGNTYDAFIHMFFGDSYYRSWFDPWEPRWYTGFATTSYPPGTHMAIAALEYVFPLRTAFVIVQLAGLLLLTVGVYRFSLLWVATRPAGYAAIAVALSSSISETVHLFGQLPTICSLGIFLNGLPYVFRWITTGRIADFAAAVVFAAATTAVHHVTTIFGGVLFILPLGLHALRAVVIARRPDGLRAWPRALAAPLGRGILLAVFMLAAIVITVFPYWWWSVTDPITQVPIPHGSRESFIERPDLGFVFFLLPWGTAILLLPYVAWKTATTRLWPLGLSVLMCFVLGTGGTTPIPRAILGGAFDILTLDRFTFWATILILPFTGYLIDGLLHGRSGEALRDAFGRGTHRVLVGGYFLATVAVAVFAAILPTIQPTQPRFIDPAPIVRFLETDKHDRWRYLTLGFGDQFAYLSSQTHALSVDGNYHSARRLPDMTRFSIERLENAKYLGVPGLGSLQQFLVNADSYNLKYVFSNDEFYDPILHFTGWSRLNRLSNGVTVWEKPDVTPLPAFPPRASIPPLHMLMWGLFPPTALALAGLVFASSALRRNFGSFENKWRVTAERAPNFQNTRRVRIVVVVVFALLLASVGAGVVYLTKELREEMGPEAVIAAYFDDIDFRRFEAAYRRLDPQTRPDYESVLFNWRWRGGLIASYGKLTDIRLAPQNEGGAIRDWNVELDWLTAIDTRTETLTVRTVRRDGVWFVAPITLRPTQSPERFRRETVVEWNVTGRRQPRAETDLNRDRLDRPGIAMRGVRLVERAGRYSMVGELANSDADPAAVTLLGALTRDSRTLARHAAGIVNSQRLLPAETGGFRIDFEGVLSLADEEAAGTFDPTMFIPPELDTEPTGAQVEARALVTGTDLYRGVTLNGVAVRSDDGAPVIEGFAVNSGIETATIVRVIALLYDDAGVPIWADAGFVETNIYPGQSAPLRLKLPARDEISVIADLTPEDMVINGSNPRNAAVATGQGPDIIPIDLPGYSAIRLQVSAMTYDPLF